MNPSAGARMPTSTMVKVGRGWGLVDMLCEQRGVALLQVSPRAIKLAATGSPSASKVDVQRALDERLGGAVVEALAGIRAATQHEHPVDALGAVIACLDHDFVRLALAARMPAL